MLQLMHMSIARIIFLIFHIVLSLTDPTLKQQILIILYRTMAKQRSR